MSRQELKLFFWSALTKNIVLKSLKVALVVGLILNLINQGEAILNFNFIDINKFKFFLTFLVPYMVSTYSAATTQMNLKVGDIAPIDIQLHCSNHPDYKINIKKSSVIPICPDCIEYTKWIRESSVN